MRVLPSGKHCSGVLKSSENSAICFKTSSGFARSTVLTAEELKLSNYPAQ